jgi:hypothetical protein
MESAKNKIFMHSRNDYLVVNCDSVTVLLTQERVMITEKPSFVVIHEE